MWPTRNSTIKSARSFQKLSPSVFRTKKNNKVIYTHFQQTKIKESCSLNDALIVRNTKIHHGHKFTTLQRIKFIYLTRHKPMVVKDLICHHNQFYDAYAVQFKQTSIHHCMETLAVIWIVNCHVHLPLYIRVQKTWC